jgi:hypothetical protein
MQLTKLSLLHRALQLIVKFVGRKFFNNLLHYTFNRGCVAMLKRFQMNKKVQPTSFLACVDHSIITSCVQNKKSQPSPLMKVIT